MRRGNGALKGWRDLANLPRELWILCFATLVNRMGTMALPFLALYITRSLGFSAARASAALALFGAVSLVTSPIAGRISDRWGALRMMETMLVVFGIVLVLFPVVHSWTGVLVMTALFAAANEAFRPANLSMIGKLSPPEHRKSAFALSRAAVNLGMSVGPAIGGFLAQSSFHLLFIVDGLSAIVAAAILFFSPFHSIVQKRKVETRSAKRWPLAAFLEDSNLRVLLLGVIPVFIVFWQHQSTLPLFLVRDLHFRESIYGLLFTLNTLMIVTMEIPLNSITAHWPHRRTHALGALLFAVGFGALAFVHSVAQVGACIAIWTMGEMLLFSGMSAYVSGIAPEGRHGEYMGLYTMSFSLSFMVAPPIGTFLLEHFGSTVLWAGMCGIGLLSVGVLGRRSIERQ